MTNKEETDPTESQIVRASVLESHGWSSEPNRSQCKLRVQEIKSLVFLLPYFFFLFVRAIPFFISRDTSNTISTTQLALSDFSIHTVWLLH